MTPEIARYLTDAYRRDILGESVEVGMPVANPDLIKRIKAEITRIDGLRLGSALASRDFASYQNRRALEKLLKQLEVAQGVEDAAH